MDYTQPNPYKYKGLTFAIMVLNVLFAIAGVLFFIDVYYIFCILSISYAILKYIQMIGILIYVNFGYKQCMISYRQRAVAGHKCTKEVTHVIILPSYEEDLELIRQSIKFLAKHSRASQYCLFLAMQKHEKQAQYKAKMLIQEFSSSFKIISYTLHELMPNQSKTKSSNINWCATHMIPKLIQYGVNLQHVIITIMDADSHIPQPYIDNVQKHIEENYSDRHLYIYQPPQIFFRNEYESAFFIRIFDNMMSSMHCSQLYSVMNFTMGVSNYSISYKLLERIGFWDTCIYSKGQDMRIAIKAFFKTNGQTKTFPIYIPISQLCLSTQQGYFSDFKARIKQAKKQMQDQVELSYIISNIIDSGTKKILNKFHILLTVSEAFLMAVLIPVHLGALGLQYLQLIPSSRFDQKAEAFMLTNNINLSLVTIYFILFYLFKFRAAKQMYGGHKLQIYKDIFAPFLQLPLVVLFGLYPIFVASFNLLDESKLIFGVTEKKLKNSAICFANEDIEQKITLQSEQIEQNKIIQQREYVKQIQNDQI